jgi:inositol transporter-like SP family MFS transporter
VRKEGRITTVADQKPTVTREQWRKTVLAAMANYIDSGSIVAGAVALPIWTTQFGFGSSFVSLLGAFSSNAISAGLGAVIGGRICDRLGRTKIFSGTCCSMPSARSDHLC